MTSWAFFVGVLDFVSPMRELCWITSYLALPSDNYGLGHGPVVSKTLPQKLLRHSPDILPTGYLKATILHSDTKSYCSITMYKRPRTRPLISSSGDGGKLAGQSNLSQPSDNLDTSFVKFNKQCSFYRNAHSWRTSSVQGLAAASVLGSTGIPHPNTKRRAVYSLNYIASTEYFVGRERGRNSTGDCWPMP